VEEQKKGKGGKRDGAGRKQIEVIDYAKPRPPAVIKLDELAGLCERGATQQLIAAYFRITEKTLSNIAKRNPEVQALLKWGRARGDVLLLDQLHAQSKTVPAVLIFLAKNRLGYSDRIANEHSGPKGKPIETVDKTPVDTSPLDDFLGRIEEMITGQITPINGQSVQPEEGQADTSQATGLQTYSV